MTNWSWLVWAVVAAGVAVTMEALFRRGVDWYTYWWAFIFPALLVNYAVFRLVTGGPSLILAVAGFNLATLAARCAVSQFIIHEPVTRGNATAVVALLVGLAASTLWR